MVSRIVSAICLFCITCSTFFVGIAGAYEAQFFLVSAYYSPLPGQSYYLHGDFENEVRINGRGKHGSSGQAVRPGMIAAPRNYPFGAKIALEGVGVGTVLDRGGAIVEADESGSFTRLDVYMGAGEEGLCRAIKFGMQSVYGTIFTLEESEDIDQDTIDFSNFSSDCDFVTGSSSQNISDEISDGVSLVTLRELVLTEPVTPKSDKGLVQELKRVFDETGYLIGPLNNDYDSNLTNTIYRFQLSQRIIMSPYDEGSGYYGPKTREVLSAFLYKEPEKITTEATSSPVKVIETSTQDNVDRSQKIAQVEISIFDTPVVEGSEQDDVRELQFVLKNLGYFTYEQDGIFNKRLVDAIFEFQVAHGVVSSGSDVGAGYYGPKTRAKLKEVYSGYEGEQARVTELRNKVTELTAKRSALINQKREENKARMQAMGTLSLNQVSGQVRELQKLLKGLGYMEASDTAIFGLATKGGLAAYQLDLGVIDRIDSQYAGILGSVTGAAIADDLTRRFELEDKTFVDEIEKIKEAIAAL